MGSSDSNGFMPDLFVDKFGSMFQTPGQIVDKPRPG